jgi:hypothetical protein
MLLVICPVMLYSQNQAIENKGTVTFARIENGDTIPVVSIPQVRIIEKREFRSKRELRRYLRLKRDVIKVYPYAKLAAKLFREYQQKLDSLPTKKQRKEFLKQAEQELKAKFEGEIRSMTWRQGVILVKLIDRETGESSYEVVKELKGSFNAFFWQQIAKLFGNDLKMRYDPEGEDREIENIVQMIENGEL